MRESCSTLVRHGKTQMRHHMGSTNEDGQGSEGKMKEAIYFRVGKPCCGVAELNWIEERLQ